jgi:hypothetical protein
MSKKSSAKAAKSYESALDSGPERFLAHLVAHALEDGWRTADDFVRHFPPGDIIASLAQNDELRAQVLVRAAKVHERLAKKKSVASASEDLSIALDEGVCEPATVLEVYQPDDQVRHLDHARLWAFVTEEAFWQKPPGDVAHETGVARVTQILELALQEQLISLRGLLQAMTFDEISTHVPEAQLRKLIRHALAIGDQGKPLGADSLVQVVPLAALVGFLPLPDVWHNVVVAKLAAPQGLVGGEGRPVPAQPAKKAPPEPAKAAAPAEPVRAAPPASQPEAGPEPEEEVDLDAAFDDPELQSPPAAPAEPAAPSAESGALAEAAEALRDLGRLPPNYQDLSIPILRSIESMYADLSSVSDDAGREAVIRESFPNESHLRKAMLALIELLDPSINTGEPLIRDADVDALIKIVLFEERRREEQRSGGGATRSNRPAPGNRRV